MEEKTIRLEQTIVKIIIDLKDINWELAKGTPRDQVIDKIALIQNQLKYVQTSLNYEQLQQECLKNRFIV